MTDAENSLHARHATVAKRLSYLPLRSARTVVRADAMTPALIVGHAMRS